LEAIGTPDGLVISSDMQKGLEAAIGLVYPSIEHRECMRHLLGNFKKKFHGDFFMKKMWGAAKTYCPHEHDKLLGEIAKKQADAITFLNENHEKIWSRSKFGTAAKCDYITNNISETFNSWIGDVRYQPVLDLLDAIREKIMVLFDKKRRNVRKWKGILVPKVKNYLNKITKNLGEYEVCRSSDNRAEVKCKGKRWEVILDEKKCSCRVWQVKGLPCVHAAAFIAFTRDANWEKYVDPYFTIEKCKAAYAMDIAPMPGKDQWVHVATEDKIYPPTIKRPPGRPKKNRYVSSDEPTRKHKCRRCGMYGHHQKTCKNPAPLMTTSQISESGTSQNVSQPTTGKRVRGKNSQAHRSKKSMPCDAMHLTV
ncbi:uncharacterized protein LOC144565543, partial [Carex rostrata]